MIKTLYLDCSMGAAGDMLAAALLELLPDKDGFIAELNALAIPGVSVSRAPSTKCGITGTRFSVSVNGAEESEEMHGSHHEHTHEHDHEHEHSHEHSHEHEHDHSHEHSHHHSGMRDIEHIIGHLSVSEKVRADIKAVYALIAEAESSVHGVPITEIHFHEVGTMDAVADITAVCLLMERIAPQAVVVSPVHVGSGQVRCAHGTLPVPAPATAHILRDVPIYGGAIKSELCTPTGAALLKHFADRFGDMPIMRTAAIGYGMGKKDFEAANCVRALVGFTEESAESVTELCCNLDDMTPEAIGFAITTLFEEGALDVYTTAVGMKKNRPGTLLSVMCKNDDKDRMISLIFKHTTTLGIRENVSRRYTLTKRTETLSTPLGEVRKKVSAGYGVTREKPEFDDLSRIAKEYGISLDEAARRVFGEAD